MIAIVEVAGPSVNRIIDLPRELRDPNRDPRLPQGINHVVTPIRVNRIIYLGEDLTVEEGDVVLALERYFYVTHETPDLLQHHPMHTIISGWGDVPMEMGRSYLIYTLFDSGERNTYFFEGNPTFGWPAAFPLDDIQSLSGENRRPNFDVMRQDILAMYGPVYEVWREEQAGR
jgi:hypothetical protein